MVKYLSFIHSDYMNIFRYMLCDASVFHSVQGKESTVAWSVSSEEEVTLEERIKAPYGRSDDGGWSEVRMKYSRARSRPLLLNYCIIVYCEESLTKTPAT